MKVIHEDPIDFPISWDWHRHYSREFMGVDPGPCDAPEHTVDSLGERLTIVEKNTDTQPQKSRKEVLEALRSQVLYLQDKLNKHLDKTGKAEEKQQYRGLIVDQTDSQ